MNATQEQIEWAIGNDTGISSLAIWSVMTGVRSAAAERLGHCNYPLDPSDFGRCYRLLKRFPEWRGRLTEVATRWPSWAGLVLNWSAIERLYEEELPTGVGEKTWALMKAVTP